MGQSRAEHSRAEPLEVGPASLNNDLEERFAPAAPAAFAAFAALAFLAALATLATLEALAAPVALAVFVTNSIVFECLGDVEPAAAAKLRIMF